MIDATPETLMGGTGLFAVLAKLAYDWIKRSAPANAQATANADLYNMLREDLKLVRKELKLVRRQNVILEHIAAANGIDVNKAYRDAGIYDEDGDE